MAGLWAGTGLFGASGAGWTALCDGACGPLDQALGPAPTAVAFG